MTVATSPEAGIAGGRGHACYRKAAQRGLRGPQASEKRRLYGRSPKGNTNGPQAPENLLFALVLPTKSAKQERKTGLGRSPKDVATTMIAKVMLLTLINAYARVLARRKL